MTLLDLITLCRSRSLDKASPPFWTDQQWTDALNEGESEACLRSRLIEDDSITASAVAQEAYIDLPPRAFSVQRVAIDGKKLEITSRDYLDYTLGVNWEESYGSPHSCYRIGNRLRLVPVPDSDADVQIVAFCTPENSMGLNDANFVSPEITDRLHSLLVHWALHLFYSTQDADYADQRTAENHEGIFIARFGPRPDEVEIRRTFSRPARPVRCSFF